MREEQNSESVNDRTGKMEHNKIEHDQTCKSEHDKTRISDDSRTGSEKDECKKDGFITRREAFARIGLGLLGFGLWSTLPIGCSTRRGHPDQSDLRIACQECRECVPCPYGIDIRTNIAVYNQACSRGILPDPRQMGSKQYASEGKALIKALSKRVPRLAQADRCVGCGRCTPLCPHGVLIPQSLRQIENLTSRVQEDLFDLLCDDGVF